MDKLNNIINNKRTKLVVGVPTISYYTYKGRLCDKLRAINYLSLCTSLLEVSISYVRIVISFQASLVSVSKAVVATSISIPSPAGHFVLVIPVGDLCSCPVARDVVQIGE